MALTATIHHFQVTLSDVDRGVYENLDLRVARHPSESARYMLTRTLGYCLSYEEGIAFSKGGISSTDEPPITVRDPTGVLVAWIDVGAPSAERLHKASKAARKVALYTHVEPALLRREASSRAIHKVGDIDVWRLQPALLDALEKAIDRTTKLELVRTDGRLYVTVDGKVIEGELERVRLDEGDERSREGGKTGRREGESEHEDTPAPGGGSSGPRPVMLEGPRSSAVPSVETMGFRPARLAKPREPQRGRGRRGRRARERGGPRALPTAHELCGLCGLCPSAVLSVRWDTEPAHPPAIVGVGR